MRTEQIRLAKAAGIPQEELDGVDLIWYAIGRIEGMQNRINELEDLRKSHAIALADAQLLGFYYCSCGYSIESLVDSMDLSQDEWGRMKNGESSTVGILHKELIEAIDNAMRGGK